MMEQVIAYSVVSQHSRDIPFTKRLPRNVDGRGVEGCQFNARGWRGSCREREKVQSHTICK